MKRYLTIRLFAAAGSAAIAASAVPTATWAADPALTDTLAVEEIVVTAQLREQKLVDAPITLTALAGAQLDALFGAGRRS